MKIFHISDLHLCRSFKRENIRKSKELIKYISEQNPDHLVITGDISDNANESDYIILKKILQAFNLYSAEKTTIIPGNHDIYGGVQRPEDIINFPSKCKKTDYALKVNTFVENFRELFANTYFPLDNEFFPFAKPVMDFLFLGINTIDKYSGLKNPMASNGKVYKMQFDALSGIFKEKSFAEQKKIVLSHHHFYKNCHVVKSSDSAIWNKIEKFTMKLRGKRKLLNLFADSKVELVLHGHSHDLKEYKRKGIHFVNAGGSIENSLLSGVNVISITYSGNKIISRLETVNVKKFYREKISLSC